MKNLAINDSAVLLRGVIVGLERSRCSHDFALSKIQHQQIGVTAIAAAATGMSAAGLGLIGIAGNSDEEAEWVTFELDGKKLQGWLWMMPMRNGDNVEVVAEQTENGFYMAYAVKRDSDQLLAVYPHATAGRKVHYRKSLRAWIWCTILAYLFPIFFFVMQNGFKILLDKNMQPFLLSGLLFCNLISAAIAISVSKKMIGFARIAEVIFKTFGWNNIENIDLRQTSRENRRENTLHNFGNLYFRYK